MDRALRQYTDENESEPLASSHEAGLEIETEQEPCTYAGHQEATATYEEFLASTSNHRPWQEPDREIDIVLGECLFCNSTLGWSNQPPDECDSDDAYYAQSQEDEQSICAGDPIATRFEEGEQPVQSDAATKSLSRFLIEEAVISHEQLVKTRSSQTGNLSDALIESGTLTAEQLEPFLRAHERGEQGATDFVSALLGKRPNSKVLEVITNQLMRSLTNTVGVRVTADGCHTNVDDVAPCDYTIAQSIIGDFEGEVYLNLSASMMLQMASTFMAKKATSVRALIEEGACDFLNTVNSNACVQLSSIGIHVALLKPRLYRHTEWGERNATPLELSKRVGGSAFTAIRWSHPGGRQELCIVDGTI
tara:strand:+ start:44408 stop:45496 length:1089 start_codon:yes stop_codon:yes gene_type:complete